MSGTYQANSGELVHYIPGDFPPEVREALSVKLASRTIHLKHFGRVRLREKTLNDLHFSSRGRWKVHAGTVILRYKSHGHLMYDTLLLDIDRHHLLSTDSVTAYEWIP